MTSPLADVQLHLVQSVDDVLACREWASQKRDTPVGFDTETEGLVPQRDRLRLLQLGDKWHGWAFPFEWCGAAIEIIRDLISRSEPLLAHNSGFDHRFIEKWLGYSIPWHLVHDTMTIAALDNPTVPKGLKPLATRLVDKNAAAGQHLLDDGMKKNGWTWATVPANYPPYWAYAALDPVLACWIWDMLAPNVLKTAPEAYDLERSVTPVLCSMMDAGLLLDRTWTLAKIDELGKYSRSARTWLKDVHGVDSLMSARQIHAALTRLDILVTGTTPTGLPSVTKEVLQAIAKAPEGDVSKPGRDLAVTILKARHAEKLTGTYLENFLEMAAADGAIHPSIKQLEARTGRMSCADPNLQNLPRDDKIVRGCFIPRPGYVFISCDYKQIEMRLAAAFSNDAGLIAAFHEADNGGRDFYSALAGELFHEEVAKEDPRRQAIKSMSYACVPLDTEILTKRGWLTHDQVIAGADETLGRDQDGKLKWTLITDVHFNDDSPLVRVENAYWHAVTTPNHRWLATVRRGGYSTSVYTEEFITTAGWPGTDARAHMSGYYDDVTGLPITTEEAALIGWALTDGHMSVVPFTGRRSQGSDGRRRAANMDIFQHKPANIPLIDAAIAATSHSRHAKLGKNLTGVRWRVRGPAARSIMQRAGILDCEPDLLKMALMLSPVQRDAMCNAMALADGDSLVKGKRHVVDLYALLRYLSNRRSRIIVKQPPPLESGSWTKNPAFVALHYEPRVTNQRLKITEVGSAPSWCVTTELGTWTMRQDDQVMLTGNSLYGAGLTKQAFTAGVSVAQLKPIRDAFNGKYPGLQTLIQDVQREANTGLQATGVPFVRTSTGRYLPAERDKMYALLNYKIQAEAGECLKRGITSLAAAGLGPAMRVPIHDEVIFEVPVADAAEAKALAMSAMADNDRYGVPITCDAKIMPERWVKG